MSEQNNNRLMNLNRIFEDIEAQAAYTPPIAGKLQNLFASASNARIVLSNSNPGINSEVWILSNLVFAKDFLMGLSDRGLVLVSRRAIQQLELASSGLSVNEAATVNRSFAQWASEHLETERLAIRLGGGRDLLVGVLLECTKQWLLLQNDDGDQILVPTSSIAVVQLLPVNKSVHSFEI